jgi:hypothetical protein
MMKRRIFLTALAAALLCGPAASAQGPSDGVGRVTVEELKALMASANPPVVVDVRSTARRVIKGALNITGEEVDSRLSELPRDRDIVFYCA